MSSRKAKHGKRRTRKARYGGHRLSNEDIENVRLSLLGVVATCESGALVIRGQPMHRRRVDTWRSATAS